MKIANYQNYFQYKNDRILSTDTAKSKSYFYESVDLNRDGKKDLILFGFTFPNNVTNSGIPQESLFYWGADTNQYFLATPTSISLPATIHPREIAYADFNNDGKLDIFLADHGWDTNPFPGGQNQLILSSPTGWITQTKNLPARFDFTHSTAIGDINNDGNIDIFIGNVDTTGSPFNASILFGDGTGRFNESTTAVPNEIRGPIRFTSAQLTDLDKDGWLDLVIGNSGDVQNSKDHSIVYWNKNGEFKNSNFSALPNGFFGKNNEHILDIQSADINGDGSNDLVLLSTQNNPFYDGWSLQILSNKGNTFIDITADAFGVHKSSMGDPYQAKKMPWIPFIKLVDLNNDGTVDILLDSIKSYGLTTFESQPFAYLNDGFGHFTPIFTVDILNPSTSYKDFFSDASTFLGNLGVSWVQSFSYENSIYIRELLPIKPLPKITVITASNNADVVIGNENNNLIFGGAGNDNIDGGLGIDTASYLGSSTSYSLSQGTHTLTVSDRTSNRDGTDILTNIERLKFSDTSLALDVGSSQNAGSVYMLYKAAFNRPSDPGGMGYWISLKDGGADIVTNIAQGFVNSAEFTAKYGANPSNSSYVNNLYQNVLGRAGEAGGVAYWIGEMDAGRVNKAQALVQFATLQEGAQLVAPLIANGIQYQEWVG